MFLLPYMRQHSSGKQRPKRLGFTGEELLLPSVSCRVDSPSQPMAAEELPLRAKPRSRPRHPLWLLQSLPPFNDKHVQPLQHVGILSRSILSLAFTMQAIHIPEFVPDPATLQPTRIPQPTPNPDEYLVRITHCSPQHADILHAQGTHQNNNRKRGWCFPPFILGYDFAGVVQSLPSDGKCSSFSKGDRVFGAAIGAFAEYVCVKEGAIRKVPDGLSNEAACAMSGQAVSYAAVVHIAKVKKGETVMVSGASGGLGSVCCMVAKAVGAKVIALAGDAEKAQYMRRDMDVDLVQVMDADWMQDIMNFTGRKGVDVFLDNTGMVNDAIRALAYFGRIIILGFAARKGVMEDVKTNKLLLKSVTVIGYRFGESGRRYPEELQKIWEGYLGMLTTGWLKPVIYGKYKGLDDVGRALGDLAQRKVYGKIVVKVADEGNVAML
jgi:NADPH:quinone reductase